MYSYRTLALYLLVVSGGVGNDVELRDPDKVVDGCGELFVVLPLLHGLGVEDVEELVVGRIVGVVVMAVLLSGLGELKVFAVSDVLDGGLALVVLVCIWPSVTVISMTHWISPSCQRRMGPRQR